MTDVIKRVEYYYTVVPNKAGEGAKVFDALKSEGINLVAYLGFPVSWGRAQLDFVPSDKDAFLAAAKKAGINIIGPKIAFLIQAEDRIGAVADVLGKLKQAQINITAMQAIASGEGRYGAILWVKPAAIDKTAQVLSAS